MDAAQQSGDRGIGPEKLTVRIFREIFAEAVLKTGELKPTLDRYLRAVLDNQSAKRGDKTYARKVYTDLVRLAGGNGLPEWAKKSEEKPLTDGDINEMLTGIPQEPPKPAQGAVALANSNTPYASGKVLGPSVVDDVSVEDINIDDLLDPSDVFLGTPKQEEPNPFEEPLKMILAEYVERTAYPFVRVFSVDGVKYAAVGTFVGTALKGEHAGKKLNVNFTVNPYRTHRTIPADVLIHRGDRALSVMHEDERECRKFLFVLRHKPGLKLRFWTRVGDADHPGGARFVILTDSPREPANWKEAHWKEVTRAEF